MTKNTSSVNYGNVRTHEKARKRGGFYLFPTRRNRTGLLSNVPRCLNIYLTGAGGGRSGETGNTREYVSVYDSSLYDLEYERNIGRKCVRRDCKRDPVSGRANIGNIGTGYFRRIALFLISKIRTNKTGRLAEIRYSSTVLERRTRLRKPAGNDRKRLAPSGVK